MQKGFFNHETNPMSHAKSDHTNANIIIFKFQPINRYKKTINQSI